jgi:hypothetical protein
MSGIRHEHRTLPVLIAVGVLLGAGLALASPAGRRSPTLTPAFGLSPSMRPSSSAGAVSPSPPVVATAAGERACDPVEPVPGWSAGHGPFAHAIHVLASGCSRGHGEGLSTVIQHLGERASGEHSTGPDHSAGGARAGHKGGHAGHQGGKDVSGSGGSGDTDGVDVAHGKDQDGAHGKNTHVADPSPGNDGASATGGSSPDHRASANERANGGRRRPHLPSAA